MPPFIVTTPETTPKSIIVVEKTDFDSWLASQPDTYKNWIEAYDFEPEDGKFLLLPGTEEGIDAIVYVKDSDWDVWSLADLPVQLPVGLYALDTELDAREATDLATGWSLGTYNFDRYKKNKKKYATLVLPGGADESKIDRTVKAMTLVRDLINTPAGDLGPTALEAAASQVAGEFEAEQTNIIGDDLLTYHFPMVHAVGRAAADAPRLIDITWGDKDAPKVTLVGKGVCFDSGALISNRRREC